MPLSKGARRTEAATNTRKGSTSESLQQSKQDRQSKVELSPTKPVTRAAASPSKPVTRSAKGAAAPVDLDEMKKQANEQAKIQARESELKLKRAEYRANNPPAQLLAGQKRKPGQRGKPQPTAHAVRTAFQDLLTEFGGVESNGTPDEQVSQYCQIRSARYQKSFVGGLDKFIKGNDYSFLIDTLQCKTSKMRRKVIKQIVMKFAKDTQAVLDDDEVKEELTMRNSQMTKADAALLFFKGGFTVQGWNVMAREVNRLGDPKLQAKYGNTVPSCKTLMRYLDKVGAKLKNEDLSVVDLLEEKDAEDVLIDLTINEDGAVDGADDGAIGGDGDEAGGQGKRPLRAAFVKDVMGRLVVPELKTIRQYLPAVYERMVDAGKVEIVLAMDNTSRKDFSELSMKLEQAVIKIVLPGIKSAQQSPTLAIPIFFMDGDETYSALQKVLTSMLGESLQKTVDIEMTDGAGVQTLQVDWILCSDHKLVALFGGFGGSGCNKPCFLCDWDRTDPMAQNSARTAEDIFTKSSWAQQYFKPIHDAQARLTTAKKVAQQAKKGHSGVSRDQQQEVDGATMDRAAAFKTVGNKLSADPEHELVEFLHDAQRLQPRVATINKKHLQAVELEELAALRADLQAAQDSIGAAQRRLERETKDWEQAQVAANEDEESESATDTELEANEQRVHDAFDRVQSAQEDVAGTQDTWASEVEKANALDGVVVRVETQGVRLYKPCLRFNDMAMGLLQSLLIEACEGMYRDAMVKDFIPPDRWYIEALHLILNTGNSWMEVARNVFHYLLNPDGSLRDAQFFQDNPAASWPLAGSGSRQKREWRVLGFDFEAHLCTVFGSRLTRPLTKYHGSQIETMFKRQAELWSPPDMESTAHVRAQFAASAAALEEDADFGGVVRDLKAIFAALSVVHKQVSIPDPDIEAMEGASVSFAQHVRTFEFPETPAPFRYRLKFYDHAVIDHIVPMSRELQKRGLSLAVVSSKFLEANNKVVKAIMRRLPGGGTRREGTFAHLPLVQGLKRCVAASRVRRVDLYQAMQKAEVDESMLD